MANKTEINIVPLVDVLIVLLFFFLLSMQFRNPNILNIVVPEIETAGKNKLNGQIEIAVDEQNQIFFNGAAVSQEELQSALNLIAATDQSPPVLLIADEQSVLKTITYIMDTCRQAGLETIRLQAR